MNKSIKSAAETVLQMDEQLRNDLFIKDGVLQETKLWENTHIKHQIDRRNNGDSFSINDHIRAMVYSMLSSGIKCERVDKGIDIETGRIVPIDDIFQNYDINYLVQCDPDI